MGVISMMLFMKIKHTCVVLNDLAINSEFIIKPKKS